jgi:nucleoside-diphosphate-sugar epimerase
MKRVLVTGARGFIGSHCLPELQARGFEVHAVSTHEVPAAAGVVWHRADLHDPAQIGPLMSAVKPSHLLHLAWYVVPGKLIASPANIDWVVSSLGLVREFLKAGGRRITVSGSGYEYDWRYGYCVESLTPTQPDTLYGLAKRDLHDLADAMAKDAGGTLANGRVFFLYGPNEHPDRLVPAIIRAVLRGEQAKSSHGLQIRDYLYVGDVASALVAILDSDVTGAVNVGSGVPVTLKEIILKIGAMLGRPDLIALGALPARANDLPLVVASIERLTKELGWQPRVSLDEGLDRTIQWWKQRNG